MSAGEKIMAYESEKNVLKHDNNPIKRMLEYFSILKFSEFIFFILKSIPDIYVCILEFYSFLLLYTVVSYVALNNRKIYACVFV